MRYPQLSEELVAILEQDQHEIREHSKLYKRSPKSPNVEASRKKLTERSAQRMLRLLEILQEIGETTLTNIGIDGSEAVVVIALHARYSDMKKVLEAFEAVYNKSSGDVYLEGIPALTDRVLMLERKKQKFGSQWLMAADDTFFLYPVEDFQHMNERRAAYGLDNARRPRDMTYGIPKGPPPPETQESDQREPTTEEYNHQLGELLD